MGGSPWSVVSVGGPNAPPPWVPVSRTRWGARPQKESVPPPRCGRSAAPPSPTFSLPPSLLQACGNSLAWSNLAPSAIMHRGWPRGAQPDAPAHSPSHTPRHTQPHSNAGGVTARDCCTFLFAQGKSTCLRVRALQLARKKVDEEKKGGGGGDSLSLRAP